MEDLVSKEQKFFRKYVIELIKEIYKHSVAKCLDSLFGQELHDIQRNFNKLYSFGNQD